MSDLDAYRAKARTWLESMAPEFGREARRDFIETENLAISRRYQRAKFDAGYAGISWSPDFGGQGLSHLEQMAFAAEEVKFGMPTTFFGVSLGMPVPILIRHGDPAFARERAIAALKGEEIWCQLFSEPSGGSDVGAVRTRATPDGNGWAINGQKVWTTWAQYCDYGVIVVRTDPTVPKHKGLTYFWVDMKAPGVTVRPIKLAPGDSHVNEVFFDDVKITDEHRLSPVGGGFGVAMETLMIERYAVADTDGYGPPLDLFVSLAQEAEVNGKPAIEDGRIRSAIARNYAMRSALRVISQRAMLMMQAGMMPGPEGSLNKLVSVRSNQRLSELALDLQGASGMTAAQGSAKEDFAASWISVPSGRIAGGADEMLLNTIAERILGLPQDHRPDKGVPFNEIPG